MTITLNAGSSIYRMGYVARTIAQAKEALGTTTQNELFRRDRSRKLRSKFGTFVSRPTSVVESLASAWQQLATIGRFVQSAC